MSEGTKESSAWNTIISQSFVYKIKIKLHGLYTEFIFNAAQDIWEWWQGAASRVLNISFFKRAPTREKL